MSENTIRVCHVTNSVGPMTGPANHAVALTKYTNTQAGILAWFQSDSFSGEEYLKTMCLNAPNTAIGIDSRTLKRAKDFLNKFDIIHAHHPHSGTFSKLIAWNLGKSIVSTEGSSHQKFTRKGRIANGLTNLLADRVTCVSNTVCGTFSKWEKLLLQNCNLETIYTGVDLEFIDGTNPSYWPGKDKIQNDSIVIGNAGRLGPPKAQDTLIRAIARVNESSDRSIELVIAGEGELRPNLEAIVQDENI